MAHSDEHRDHGHGSHPGAPEEGEGMGFGERLGKILDHWIKHNRDHAATYRDWAERARKAGLDEAAGLLEEAAELNLQMNETFEKAKQKAAQS